MGFTRKIQYYLVHTLNYSNKEAKHLISTGAVCVNTIQIKENIELQLNDEIKIHKAVVKNHHPFIYIAYHKPVGFVSSLNAEVDHSLYSVFKQYLPLYIAGRLDKYSDGLLLLSNDGKWVKAVTDPKNAKEKEYVVTVSKPIGDNFIKQMAVGVDIGICKTLPCQCNFINENTFSIILTEGKNKQIRRMCKTLGNQVTRLKRIRIDRIKLNDLQPGEIKVLNL